MNVVFTGHVHFYERLKPQNGVHYFIAGSSGKLRRGDIEDSNLTAKGFDQGYTFMFVEIDGDEMRFRAISETGQAVDAGTIRRTKPMTSTRPQ